MMPSRTPGFDNPDYVHLKSLSDMLKNIVLWAQAADAQCQILMAKRAPVLNLRPASKPEPCGEVALKTAEPTALADVPPPPPVDPDKDVHVTATAPTIAKENPLSKGDLWKRATAIGIPESVLESPDYLGTKGRPSLTGMIKTKKLVDDAMDKIVMGEDPSVLWAAPAPEEPEAETQPETLFDFSSEPV